MDRRLLLASAAAAMLVAPAVARAAGRDSGKRRLGVLLFDNAESWSFFVPELGRELAALGWVEGANLAIEWHYADRDAARLRAKAAELVASSPDALLVRGSPATLALQQATTTIPILTGVGDPVGSGFARTLARPGGNITGITWAAPELMQKQVELVHRMVPGLRSLILVAHASRAPFMSDVARHSELPAKARGLTFRTMLVEDANDLRHKLGSDFRPGETAALVSALGKLEEAGAVAEAALAAKLPTMFEYRFYVDAGGLASYRFNWDNQTQRAATQLDKVFRGEKPARIPFEMPTRSEFVLNRSTARALGLNLPKSLLSSADAIVG